MKVIIKTYLLDIPPNSVFEELENFLLREPEETFTVKGNFLEKSFYNKFSSKFSLEPFEKRYYEYPSVKNRKKNDLISEVQKAYIIFELFTKFQIGEVNLIPIDDEITLQRITKFSIIQYDYTDTDWVPPDTSELLESFISKTEKAFSRHLWVISPYVDKTGFNDIPKPTLERAATIKELDSNPRLSEKEKARKLNIDIKTLQRDRNALGLPSPRKKKQINKKDRAT